MYQVLVLSLLSAATGCLSQSESDIPFLQVVKFNKESGVDFQALILRFQENENLVKELLERVDDNQKTIQILEARDTNRQVQIQRLEGELEEQRRRTHELETTLKQLLKADDEYTATNGNTDNIRTETLGDQEITSTDDGSIATTNRIRRAEGELPVAFTATISDHYIEHAGDHQVIVFDNVITNVGNAYNGHVGIFVAPVNGIYVFSVTLFSPASVSFHANIVKNGEILTWLYLSGFEIKGYDTASQTIALQLQKGDDVSIQHRDVDRTVVGFNYTTFTGFLLQEDMSSPIVVG